MTRLASREAVLLADIGGTNVRFALWSHGIYDAVASMRVAEYPDATVAIRAYLDRENAPPPRTAVLAVAGPVTAGRAPLHNSPWRAVDGAAIGSVLGIPEVVVLNDLEAVAWALPVLDATALRPLGGAAPLAGAPMVALAPGTGLGAACWLSSAGQALATEAGHATLAGTDAREDAVVARLRARFGHASAERALSGPGLVNLYRAIAELDGVSVPERGPKAISGAAMEGSCPVCVAALEMFCALLGSVAGNLALTFAARGGIMLAGGIPPAIVDFLPRSAFRERFEAKGRFRDWLSPVPTAIITRPHVALMGLAALAARREVSP